MTKWDNHYTQKELETWLYGRNSLTGATRSWLIRQAKKWTKNSLFLDAGCGGGVTAFQFGQEKILDNIQYLGVDFSQCMLDLAHKKVTHRNACFQKYELDSLKLNQKFDYILLRAVLEHNLDPTKILASSLQHLKDDGTFYLIFWNNPVKAKKVIFLTPGGFYDNSHSEEELRGVLTSNNCVVHAEHTILENSFNSNIRIIWEIKHV